MKILINKIISLTVLFILIYSNHLYSFNIFRGESFYPQDVWTTTSSANSQIKFIKKTEYKNYIEINLNDGDNNEAIIEQDIYSLFPNIEYEAIFIFDNISENTETILSVILFDVNNKIIEYSTNIVNNKEIKLDFVIKENIKKYSHAKVTLKLKGKNKSINIKEALLKPKNYREKRILKSNQQEINMGFAIHSLKSIDECIRDGMSSKSFIFKDFNKNSSKVKNIVDKDFNIKSVFTQIELNNIKKYNVAYSAGGFEKNSHLFSGKFASKENLTKTAFLWYTFAKQYGDYIKTILIEDRFFNWYLTGLNLSDYTLYISAIYTAIKTADSSINVIIPITQKNDRESLVDNILDMLDKYGIGSHIDTFGYNLILSNPLESDEGYSYKNLLENKNDGIITIKSILKDRNSKIDLWVTGYGIMSDYRLKDNISHDNEVFLDGHRYRNVSGERASMLYAYYITSALIYSGVENIFWTSYDENMENSREPAESFYSIRYKYNNERRGLYKSINNLFSIINKSKIINKSFSSSVISIELSYKDELYYLTTKDEGGEAIHKIATINNIMAKSFDVEGEISVIEANNNNITLNLSRLTPKIILINSKAGKSKLVIYDSFESDEYIKDISGIGEITTISTNAKTFKNSILLKSDNNNTKLKVYKNYDINLIKGYNSIQVLFNIKCLDNIKLGNNSKIGIFVSYSTNGSLAYSNILEIKKTINKNWQTISSIIPLEENMTDIKIGFALENSKASIIIDDLALYVNPSVLSPVLSNPINITTHSSYMGVSINILSDVNQEYYIYRSLKMYDEYIKISSIIGNKYNDTTAIIGNTYYYQIVAIDKFGYEGYFNSAINKITHDGKSLPSADVKHENKNGYITFTILPSTANFDKWVLYKIKDDKTNKIYIENSKPIYHDFDIKEGSLSFCVSLMKDDIEGELSKIYTTEVSSIQFKGEFIVSKNVWNMSSGEPLLISVAPNKNYQNVSFYLYTLEGRRVMEFENRQREIWTGNIRKGRGITDGVYIILMIADKKKYFKRIVITH